MATSRKANPKGNKAVDKPENIEPRSLKVAAHGIRTGKDFANCMSALMSDIIEGRVTPSVGNAACNAGGKLLKIVELQQKYGTQGKGANRVLELSDGTEPEQKATPVRREAIHAVGS